MPVFIKHLLISVISEFLHIESVKLLIAILPEMVILFACFAVNSLN